MIAPLFALLLAVAQPPALNSDVLLPINIAVKDANSNDAAQFDTLTTDDAVVIDDFSPHIWRGKTALGDWWRAFKALGAKAHIENVHAAGDDITQYDIKGDAAYVVVPLTITYAKGGDPVKITGLWTFTLQKIGSVWKISTVTWGTLTHS